jgi:hypothetical protein
MYDESGEALWIYTQAGGLRFCSRGLWQSIFTRIVKGGWESPSADQIAWLNSRLNPYPPGSFFSASDAASFALAVGKCLSEDTGAIDRHAAATMQKLAALFRSGPVFIWSEPPRKTASTGLVEVVHVYACPQCGFLHHGSWLFDTAELSLEEIRSSVESMLKYQYCPLCGSKDLVSVAFFLPPFDPDHATDFMSCQASSKPEA